MFKIVKQSDEIYRIYIGKYYAFVGNFEKDVDGYFYYWPRIEEGNGCWASNLLKELSLELDKLNKPWDEEVKKYFEQDKKNNPNLYKIARENPDFNRGESS